MKNKPTWPEVVQNVAWILFFTFIIWLVYGR